MKTQYGSIAFLIAFALLITLESCSSSKNISTINSTSTNSIITLANTPSNTPMPTNTSTQIQLTNTKIPNTPTYTITKILITNTSITKWNNIPIMKGAYNIEDGETLSYSIKSTVANVYTYYLSVMKSLGYSVFADSSGGKGKMTIYTKGDELKTIAIAPDQNEEGVVLVIIT